MTNKITLSPTQKAWLAGFIDGEGFIGITFQRKKENSQQSASPLFHPYLIITNTNKKSILYIKELVGEGNVYELKSKNRSLSPAFQFKLTKRGVLNNLLKLIKPYLIIKKEQCQILLKFLEIREKKQIVTGYGSRGVTSFSYEDEGFYRQLLVLNKRGNRKNDETSLS